MQPRALQPGPDLAVTARVAPPSREPASGCAWQLVELLGRGGGAHVWRAVDAAGRSVALKIPRAPFDPRFDGSSHWLLREHAPGGDLVSLVGIHPRHWIAAACGVHAALTHLHARGFVHRDVKARNVLFGTDGRARLIDFASALPCGAAAVRGGTTAAHRAPGRSAAAAPHDDAYAFAVLLYELLAGRLPYGPTGRAAAAGAADPAPPAAAGAVPAVAALAQRVLDVLGSRDAGLSVFSDVLESAAAALR
jgi:serine/threonine protein kinase